jgi:hypothetical protein
MGTETISTNRTYAQVGVSALTTQGWLTGWSYRQQHNITQTSGAGVGYQFNITVSNASQTSSGSVCYANGHVKNSDFSDIRVTASDGVTLLSIWNETVNSGVNATIWFKDPDNLTSGGSTVYVYYGNAGASPVWNGASTFISFDNFTGTSLNTTTWATLAGSAGSYSVNNGLTLKTTNTYQSGGFVHVYTNSLQSTTSTIAEASVNPSGTTTSWDILAWDTAAPSTSATNDAGFTTAYRFEDYPSAYWRLVKDVSGTGTTIAGGTTGGSGTGSLVKLGAYWPSAGTEKLFVNNTDTLDATDSSIGHANSYLDLVLESNTASAQSLSFYWCRIRSYVSPEPAQGAWGAEKSDTVLNVVNQVSNAWNVNLQVYSSSNIVRLTSVIIRFHDGTSSNQIVVSNGVITQSQGALYSLPGGSGSAIYVGMSSLVSNATGTSYLYVYLTVSPLSTSAFYVLHIYFQIT